MESSNAHWTRPVGPPIVWKIIHAKEKLDDNTFADVRLSIQDIPEDRYKDALEHLCEYYVANEAFCISLKLKDDLDGFKDNRSVWDYCLKLGMSIGLFKLDSNDELEELVGVMILLVSSDENRKRMEAIWMNTKSVGLKNYFMFVSKAADNIDVRKMFGVDKYIHEWGMSIKSSFRGQKIGVQLLEVWSDIGRKYGISAGTCNFSTPMSQKQGERAGFKTLFSVKYSEALDENGQPMFPNIPSEKLTVCAKKLY